MEKKTYLQKGDWIVDRNKPTFIAQVLDIADSLVVCDCIVFPINQLSDYRKSTTPELKTQGLAEGRKLLEVKPKLIRRHGGNATQPLPRKT